MEITSESECDLDILEQIEQDPNATQAGLASQIGVAVGTINFHLKRLVAKGYVKVRRAERRKLRYLITPEGISLRARLTVDYIQNSFRLYRLVRERMVKALAQVQEMGYDQIRLESDSSIDGANDVVEICRLTCIEQNVKIVQDGNAPLVKTIGLKVFVER